MKIGVAFDIQEDLSILKKAHDVEMDMIITETRRILNANKCFLATGNTWGYDPETSLRFTNRYTQLIQSELNDDVIIEEGLNGRTLCQNDPYDPDRNGCLDIKRCIKSHLPLDVLVIMLGTNDAKRMYNTNVYSLEKGMNALLDKFLIHHCIKRDLIFLRY